MQAFFTIDSDNNIMLQEAAGEGTFSTEADLQVMAEDWPMERLVEVWNSFAGVAPFDDLKPVTEFADGGKAVTAIWKAIQRLVKPAPVKEKQAAPAAAEAAQPAAPAAETDNKETTTMAKKVTSKKKTTAPKAKKNPAPKKTAAAKTPKTPRTPGTFRDGSASAKVLEMLKQKGGTTNKAIQKVTGWQPHTVRGFLSATVGKKMGLTVISAKEEGGERTYSIKKG